MPMNSGGACIIARIQSVLKRVRTIRVARATPSNSGPRIFGVCRARKR